eukprot:TRINITY_DN514_c0_g1_i2.p1 TRINITY_DN514_c0_g1~~TRINITY_DN514_c0_g1_i2.p1  ORF type:complete len:531 (-),score=111.92 TRINITY_DN514_c0_g1_i2:71-1663(-)
MSIAKLFKVALGSIAILCCFIIIINNAILQDTYFVDLHRNILAKSEFTSESQSAATPQMLLPLAAQLRPFLPLEADSRSSIVEFNTASSAVSYVKTLFGKSDVCRKSIYMNQVKQHGDDYIRFQFTESDLTPRCTEAGVTTFPGPVLIGRCASLITKDIVMSVNDFPTLKNDPGYCQDLYVEHFKAGLDGGPNGELWNKPLNLSGLFVADRPMDVISHSRLVPIIMMYGSKFPHVVKDTMPRVMLSLPYMAAHPDAKLVVENSTTMVGMLERLGVPLSRVLFTKQGTRSPDSHFKPTHSTLYHASEELAYPHCAPGPMATGMYSAEVYQALRDLLVREETLPFEARNKIVYVSREGGDNSQMRRIDNEAQLMNNLKNALDQHWSKTDPRRPEFVKFRGNVFTLEQSIELFRNARVVFGPHGGGFYNLIFAAPETRVVELSPDDYGKHEVARFATILGLDYRGYVKSGMSRNETFGDVDSNWVVEEVLQAYNSTKFHSTRDAPPEPYIRHQREWIVMQSKVNTPEEARALL